MAMWSVLRKVLVSGAAGVLASLAVGSGTANATPPTFTCRTTQVIPGGSLYARVCLQYGVVLGRGPVYLTDVYLTTHTTGYTFDGNLVAWISGSNSSGYYQYYNVADCDISSDSHMIFDSELVCQTDIGNDGQPYQQGQADIRVNGQVIRVYSPTVPV